MSRWAKNATLIGAFIIGLVTAMCGLHAQEQPFKLIGILLIWFVAVWFIDATLQNYCIVKGNR